jgi:hypothetical protein
MEEMRRKSSRSLVTDGTLVIRGWETIHDGEVDDNKTPTRPSGRRVAYLPLRAEVRQAIRKRTTAEREVARQEADW